mgnify:CR=1 FL=1|tara:strand:- start:248 stop:772 length:525 start_codon:yes stop_codon:yes gene_type:complete
MELLEKVKVNPNICGISLDFAGELTPENSQALQNFYNSVASNNVWNDSYFGKKTVSFSEVSKTSRSGIQHTQTLRIKFPSNDARRSDRLQLFTKVKFVKMLLDNGTSLIIGRNDFFQNKRPEVSISSSEKISTITFTTKSIFTTGFYNATNNGGANDYIDDLLPHDIPITFLNI